jgi:hypothetical protein
MRREDVTLRQLWDVGSVFVSAHVEAGKSRPGAASAGKSTSGSAVTLRELLGLQRNEVKILLLLFLSESSFTAQLDKLV